MTITADVIVAEISKGVTAALNTKQLFLGIEQGDFENADIHPEYVTTVKVAENLTGPDRVVSLEAHMKMLRQQALGIARMQSAPNQWPSIKAALDPYRFGRKDSQRLDILVQSSSSLQPPLLLVEAKLGVCNLPGVLADIDRIVKLLEMYQDASVLNHIYGAVVFHLMEKDNLPESVCARSAEEILCGRGTNFLTGIQAHLKIHATERPWLHHKAGLLVTGQTYASVSGYQEIYDDGREEDVFAKGSFVFAPGLVLLGNANDIESVTF